MTHICWYFQVHQPFRIRPYQVFDIGSNHEYFNEHLNSEEFRKISYHSYLPMNYLLLELLQKHPELRISFSISGVAIEQMQRYFPDVLESFKKLVQTGQVELLNETYYHSLSALYSKEEFHEQISQHKKIIKHHFEVEPKVFRNTELIYSNEISNNVAELGFKGMLLEGWGPALNFKNPNFVYSNNTNSLKLLAKNYDLSDDIAQRFSNKAWEEWPLNAHKYAKWIKNSANNTQVVNLFMDYETFGGYHLESSGIFDFMKHLPQILLEDKDIQFTTPSAVIDMYESVQKIDIENPISWSNNNKDLTLWRGNSMQEEVLNELYSIEEDIKKYGNLKDLQNWKKLTTSDNFYYMSSIHLENSFNIKNSYFESPYEAYIYFKNILRDLKDIIIKEKQKQELLYNQQKEGSQSEV